MFLRTVIIFVLAASTPLWSQSKPQNKTKSIKFDGKEFPLSDTGNNPGGEFARYILPGEDADNYTFKIGTLLVTNAVNNDPIDTAKFAMENLQKNPALVFSDQILVNRAAPAAIVIFGFRFPDGDYQLNVWKYEKRLYGVFCEQIMLAAPKGVDPAAFKKWAADHKGKLVQAISPVHWSPTPNQSLFE
ncbi:MAG: hypothetical protein ABIP97_12230 [Chthoniobacterales bacterium]